MSQADYAAGFRQGRKEGIDHANRFFSVAGYIIMVIGLMMLAWVPIIFALRWAWTRWV